MTRAFLNSQMIKLCQQVANCMCTQIKNLFQDTMLTSKVYTFKANQKNRVTLNRKIHIHVFKKQVIYHDLNAVAFLLSSPIPVVYVTMRPAVIHLRYRTQIL